MPEQQPQVDEVFDEALRRAAGPDRARYLDEACGGDLELRRRVERLLRAASEAGSFLEAPAQDPSPTVDQPPGECPGTVIGPYKLLEQIGEGGFGVVFLAEQTQPVRRRVALKVLKPGMDTRQVVARFEAERQALALMDHPNIAQVHDGGTTADGRPYFVMELVKGIPITEYCDQCQLTTRQRLELLLSVCSAVQHAHQKGVIHRDIKPSNVLVAIQDGQPTVKVIDFGVAKAINQRLSEHTLVTGFHQLIGTPLYMSPEQAEMSPLDVDTRADIYALGVLLYELLTGTTPFEKERFKEASYDELRRIIREEEPPQPSARLSTLQDKLTTVAAQRRTGPRQLLRTVKGELDWIVMKALEKDRSRRYETANGFAMDVQRYLADEPVLACPPSVGYRLRKFVRRNKTALMVAGLILFFLVALGVVVGSVMYDRAVQQSVLADRINRALADAESFYQNDKLAEAMAAVQRAEDLLAAGAGTAELHQHVRQWRTDLQMVVRLEEIRQEMSAVSEAANRFDLARGDPAYGEAFLQYGLDMETLDPDWAAERIRESAIKRHLLAALDVWVLAKASANLPGREHLLAIAQRADDDPWRAQIRDAYRRQDWKAMEAMTQDNEVLAQPPETLTLLAATLRNKSGLRTILRQAQQRHPDDFWINQLLAEDLLHQEPAQPDQAVGFFRAAVALRPQSPGAHFNLGFVLNKLDELAEAEAEFREAVRLKPDYSAAHDQLGNVLERQGKLQEAEAEGREAIRLQPDDAGARVNLGVVLERQGRLQEAEAEYRESIRLNPNDAGAHGNLANVLMEQGKPAEAEKTYRHALSLCPEHKRRLRAEIHSNLGVFLNKQRRSVEAEVEFRQALRLQPDGAVAYIGLGAALDQQGKPEEAQAAYRTATQLKPNDAHVWCCLGDARRDQKKLDDAIAAYRKALQIDGRHRNAWINLGAVLHDQKKEFDEAATAFRKALEINARDAVAWYNLGNALNSLKKLDEAIAAYREAIRFKPDYADAYASLAGALRKQGKPVEAEAACREAIRFKPDYAIAHVQLACALIGQGKHTEAEAVCREAIRLKPDLADAHSNLGGALLDQGKPVEAEAACREAIRLKPDLATAHNNLGGALYVQGKLAEAEAEYREAIRLDPDLADTYFNLGNLFTQQKQPAQAEDATRRGLKIRPNDARGHTQLGEALYNQGKLGPAEAAFREAIRLKPDLAYAHFGLGNALGQQGKHPEAAASFREAIRLKPDFAEAHTSLGTGLSQQGKYSQAEAAHREAIRLKPDFARAHYGLGAALGNQGKWAEAEPALREAIRLEPNNASAYHGLGRALGRQKKWLEATATLENAIRLKPNHAPAHSELAEIFLTCPETNVRNPSRAVELARKAVELGPQSARDWQLLGWAQYRTGNWKASIEALEKSCKLQKGGTGACGQWIVLALAHGQLAKQDGLPEEERARHRTEARRWYDKAVKQIDGNPDQNETMQAIREFRAEAAKLLDGKE